jgi:hypothetical protein
MQRSRRLHEVSGAGLPNRRQTQRLRREDYETTRAGRATRPTSTTPGASNSACKPGNGRDSPHAVRCWAHENCADDACGRAQIFRFCVLSVLSAVDAAR